MESRIQSYLRFAASQQRDTEQIGPFLATFSRHSANPYLNYAIPDDEAAPSLADVNALIAAYSVRGRKPRLEYVAKLAPAVEETLISAGFTVEGRLPLMTCTPGSEKLLPLPRTSNSLCQFPRPRSSVQPRRNTRLSQRLHQPLKTLTAFGKLWLQVASPYSLA
jgi:hypothetical protein